MSMLLPASDQSLKIVDAYRRSKRVSREKALEQLLLRAEETLSFEKTIVTIKNRNRNISPKQLLKTLQDTVQDVRVSYQERI